MLVLVTIALQCLFFACFEVLADRKCSIKALKRVCYGVNALSVCIVLRGFSLAGFHARLLREGVM